MNRTASLAAAVVIIIAAIAFLQLHTPHEAPALALPSAGNASASGSSAPQQLRPGSPEGQMAPALQGIAGYINANASLTMASLRGKVVLIDFWTYSCINCIRTQPYLNAWYSRYKNDGLVIIGVHTPEFDFEKDYQNVLAAVRREHIAYPVVLDNRRATWDAYHNQYWPRKYLIDAQGVIRYDVIGEGSYAQTEQEIQTLLMERNASLSLHGESAVNATAPGPMGTPEIYLGYATTRGNFGSSEGLAANIATRYALPSQPAPNFVYLGGLWTPRADSLELNGSSGVVMLRYYASSVNIVAGAAQNATVSVLLDGKPVGAYAGEDAPGGVARVSGDRLYNVVRTPAPGAHTVALNVTGSGFRLFTFTFG